MEKNIPVGKYFIPNNSLSFSLIFLNYSTGLFDSPIIIQSS
ncbi:hypothetical protein OENI_400009 [Oenococcus oeni]|nr:hypothetical protein OENI_400009 [Oenococcus oeni]